MVRTRANNAAVRKAVAAKAPRKAVAPVRTVVSPSSNKSKVSKRGGGGNVAKAWPTPSWQKGIELFLADESGSGDAVAGCSSSSSREGTVAEERLRNAPKTTTGEESESEQEDANENGSDSEQEQMAEEENGSEDDENNEEVVGEDEEEDEDDSLQEEGMPTAKLLSDDIATLGSDDDD